MLGELQTWSNAAPRYAANRHIYIEKVKNTPLQFDWARHAAQCPRFVSYDEKQICPGGTVVEPATYSGRDR